VYPFELKQAVQCAGCKQIYHRRCYRRENCPKCFRTLQRKLAISPVHSPMSSPQRTSHRRNFKERNNTT
jgi:Rubicon Homology Domain